MKNLKINYNKTINKAEIKNLINWFIVNYGSLRVQKLLDQLKSTGFKYSTKQGISLCIEDLKIPTTKKLIFSNTEREIKRTEKKYLKGKINSIKRTEKINQLWNITNDLVKNEVVLNFKQTSLINPLYMMTLSGARGNLSQIRQLVGMRGLMSDSQGEIINLPIKTNFKEGLNLIEYFISCYGARKGLVDTALKTANSGYLTRRLIYVGQSEIIRQTNCQTKNKSIINVSKKTKENYKITKEKLLGRVIAKDILDKEKGNVIISKDQDICNVRFE